MTTPRPAADSKPPQSDSASLTRAHYDFVSGLLRERAGIVLEDKDYLIDSRLRALVVQLGEKQTLDSFVRKARTDRRLQESVVDAMTTNETSFFRDPQLFDILRDSVLPQLHEQQRATRRLRIWCAACASGQEPYSLAILIREQLPWLLNWDVQILATDISGSVLDRARKAEFNRFEVGRGLGPDLVRRYFDEDGTTWRIRDEIRSMVQFKPVNLVTAWPPMPAFDLVLLRNVLIYFSREDRDRVLQRASRVMSPEGYLFLGASEASVSPDTGLAREEFARLAGYRPMVRT